RDPQPLKQQNGPREQNDKFRESLTISSAVSANGFRSHSASTSLACSRAQGTALGSAPRTKWLWRTRQGFRAAGPSGCVLTRSPPRIVAVRLHGASVRWQYQR